jgi:hypothetical protein
LKPATTSVRLYDPLGVTLFPISTLCSDQGGWIPYVEDDSSQLQPNAIVQSARAREVANISTKCKKSELYISCPCMKPQLQP